MPRSQNARFSFSAGVLSPRVSGQPDIGRNTIYDMGEFDKALELGENFLISPQGGLVMRQGFKYMTEASVLAEPNRIFQFHRGGDISDLIVEVSIGDAEIHIYEEGSEINLAQASTHLFEMADLPNLYFTNQEVTGVILAETRPPYYIEKDAISGEYSGFHMEFNQIPLHTYYDSKSPRIATGTTVYDVTFPVLWLQGETYTLRYDGQFPRIDGGGGEPIIFVRPWDDTTPGSNSTSIELLLNAVPALANSTISVSVPVGVEGPYQITIGGENAGRPLEFVPRSGQPDSVFVEITSGVTNPGSEPAWTYPYVVQHPDGNGNYFQCILPHVSENGVNDPVNGIGVYWTDLGASPPEWWDYQHGGDNLWQDETAYGPWDRGFPSVGVFHQQRLILMANTDAPTAIWGSRIGDYHDFALGVNDDEPFAFDLDTSDSPKIKWAESQQHLVIGTSSGDFNLTAQVTLGPGDIQVLKQNNARSHHTRAVTIDTDVMYIEQGREKIRSTGYLRNVDARMSHDISIQAEHLLHVKARRVVVTHSPEAVIYILREDNSLAFFTYLRSGQDHSAAWGELPVPGDVVDIAAYYNETTSQDELYATLTYDGGLTFYIQKMDYPSRTFIPRDTDTATPLSEQGVVLMDAWVEFNDTDQSLLPLLWFKEGDTVAVTVDDEWVGEFVATASGVPLDDTYSGNFAMGYKYNGRAITFEASEGNPKGTAMGTARRWNKLYVRTLDSAIPKVQGELPPDRTPATEMDIAEIIRIGIQDLEFVDLGYKDGRVEFLQDRPYPTHILGFWGEFTSSNA